MQEPSTNGVSNANKSELWSLSLRDLFYKYVRFLPIFVLSVAVALFGAYAYLRYATPIYSTQSTMVIKTGDPNGRNDKYDDIFGGSKGSNIQSEIEVLKSKGLMTRVVQKKNLQYSYFIKGQIKSQDIYKQTPFKLTTISLADSNSGFTLKLKFNKDGSFKINKDPIFVPLGREFRNQFGIFRIDRVGTNKFSSALYSVVYTPTAQAASAFAGGIVVTPKSLGTGIINISMQSTSAMLAADVINQLMTDYGDYTRELKMRTADSTLAFIDGRMVLLGKELDSVQDRLLKYTQSNNLIDMDRQSNAFFSNISDADKAINNLQLQMTTADFVESYLGDKKNSNSQVLVPSSLGLSDATLNGLIGQYNQLQLERQALKEANIPVNNPVLVEMNMQVEKIRINLLENLANIKRSFVKTIGAMKNNSNAAQEQLTVMPAKERGYFEIKRQVEMKQAIFTLLQQKREETAISKAATVGNSQIVEYAYVSNTPISPQRKNIQIIAILAGLAIPALFIFGAELFNDKVTTRFDVEKITNAPILGEVGHSFKGKSLIVNKTTRSMVAEQFRIIRSNLQYIIGKKEKNTIMVTSSFSGEGKSFVSLNVASVMALAGKKTIILELDIRKPKIISGLNMAKGPGLTNYLIGKSDLEELIQPVPDMENLYVLGCGPVPPNPAELLLDPKVEEMFKHLQEKFDVVVIDTAPVGMVSDAQTLSKFADCSLYIVRQGYTFKKQITLVDEFYLENKLPHVAIIINDVKIKAGYGYYGYGRYGYGQGYGYGYGSYYEEETAPPSMLEKVIDKLNPFNKGSKKK